MNGTVEALTPDWRGATLLTAVGSVLTVDDVADFDEEGGWLTIADAAPLEYVAVDEDADTVTLTGTAGTVEAGDPIAVWDPTVPPTGAKVVEYLASVMTDLGPVDAVLDHEKIPLAGVDTLVGASVSLTEDDYGTPYVDQVLGREAIIDGAAIDASTLDVDSLPPLPPPPPTQTFSTSAPSATAGYDEDHAWWQVDGSGNVLGFWRLISGAWVAQTIVTADALIGKTIRTAASGRRAEVVSTPDNLIAFYSGSGSEQLSGYMEADVSGTLARLVIAAPDTDESNKLASTYRNMILMSEDTTDATAIRESRVIKLRTGHFYIEAAGGGLIHVDGTGSDPMIDLDSSNLINFTLMNGSVGIGTFRDSVDARANAMSAARMQAGTVSSGTMVAATVKQVAVTFPTAFSSAPKVVASEIIDPASTIDRRVWVVPGSETTTGFTAAFLRASGTGSYDANWIAVKP